MIESELITHIPCFSHVANRAIVVSLEIVGGTRLLQRVVDCASYFNQSLVRRSLFDC